VLAIAPGNVLDHHATIPAIDAAHAVQPENQKAPQRNELEAALGEMIVTWCRTKARVLVRRRIRDGDGSGLESRAIPWTDDFQGEDCQSKPRCYLGAVRRCFRLLP